MQTLLRPPALRPGATIGVFTPSFPAHVRFREKYLHGVAVLEGLGFRVVEGPLTAKAVAEGYRSGPPEARAEEVMALFARDDVDCLMSTIGGQSSSSLVPYLDFGFIRRHPKVVCGYSDVTSLHLALRAFAGLSTFYGPAVMPSFGEWPEAPAETTGSFLDATMRHLAGRRQLARPDRWSDHFRDAATDAWRTVPRDWQDNAAGWRVLQPGRVTGPLVAGNLNTLLSTAGTPYFPDVEGAILLVEQMAVSLSREERQLRQLEAMGVLDRIAGLIVGKPEAYDPEGAPFGYDDVVQEVLGPRSYPVVAGFDCAHTVPMLTLAQGVSLTMDAPAGGTAEVWVDAPMVEG